MVAKMPYLDLSWISRSSVHLIRFVCCSFSDDPNASLHSGGKLDFVSSTDINVSLHIILKYFWIGKHSFQNASNTMHIIMYKNSNTRKIGSENDVGQITKGSPLQ